MQKKEINPGWRSHAPDANHVFVFLHGLFSNAAKCWTSPSNGAFWPDLVANDPRLGPAAVYLADYHTSLFAGDYGISDCARAILAELVRPTSDGTRVPINFDQIIFVGHSMGGIIARYIIESNRDIFSNKNTGILLMASPSVGSDYADATNFLEWAFSLRQRRELKRNNDLLRDLDFRFKDIVAGPRRWPKLIGAEAVEHKGPFFGFKPVVLTDSAGRYFGAPTTIPQTTHSSIVKPTSTSHPSHNFLVDFFTSNFKGQLEDPPPFQKPRTKEATKATPNTILFDIYSAKAEPYYLVRDTDGLCLDALKLHSVWIHGPSGVGKTSVARRIISQRNARPVEVYLANYTHAISEDELISEIFSAAGLDSVGNESSANEFHRLTKDLVERAAETDVVLYIDEVPAGEAYARTVSTVAKVTSQLLAKSKATSIDGNLRFIISSIECPNFTTVNNIAQLSEHLRVIRLSAWDDTEIRALCNLLLENLKVPRLDDRSLADLVRRAEGLPRFVKVFFRYQLSHPDAAFAECIHAALVE